MIGTVRETLARQTVQLVVGIADRHPSSVGFGQKIPGGVVAVANRPRLGVVGREQLRERVVSEQSRAPLAAVGGRGTLLIDAKQVPQSIVLIVSLVVQSR